MFLTFLTFMVQGHEKVNGNVIWQKQQKKKHVVKNELWYIDQSIERLLKQFKLLTAQV